MRIKNYTNHKLLMESGRWNNIDRVNILCTKSDDITIGAEYHYIMKCQHIFGKQTGYIFQSPKTIKTWTTKHYASLNQWYNTE